MIKKDEGAKYARIQLVIPKDVLARVRETAGSERRNTSNMIVTLLDEAFAARAKAAQRMEIEPGQTEAAPLFA
jgi:hypothetical protein